jgi:response regulator RpfG family c-di-GMP phosphodiesterase
MAGDTEVQRATANELPVAAIDTGSEAEGADATSSSKKAKKVILAIDDIPVSLSTIRSILKDAYDVRLSKTVKLAIQILNVVRVDLILLDIEMPNVSGFDFLRYLRSIPDKKDIPVIFVTSHKNADLINEAVKIGANGYILKPISPHVLTSKINSVLEERKAPSVEFDEDEVLRLEIRAQHINSIINLLLHLKDACKSGKSGEILSLLQVLRQQNFGIDLNKDVDTLYQLALTFEYETIHKNAHELIERLIK